VAQFHLELVQLCLEKRALYPYLSVKVTAALVGLSLFSPAKATWKQVVA
jgi:hypothetical protein